MTLKIGTRGSELATWQARQVRDALFDNHPDVDVELVEVETTGDVDPRRFDVIEGRGIFVRELDVKVADGEIDAAVHSLKDVPTELIDGVELAAYLPRGPRQDALVSPHGALEELPDGATIGTSSPRRKAQLLRARDDLEVADLRGNVPTRVQKAHDELDGAVLARAGLERLGIQRWTGLDEDDFPPAPGQGIVCATAQPGSKAAEMLADVDHAPTALVAKIERQIIATLGVGCHTPLGVRVDVDEEVQIMAELLSLDGSETVRESVRASEDDAVEAAKELARSFLTRAEDLL